MDSDNTSGGNPGSDVRLGENGVGNLEGASTVTRIEHPKYPDQPQPGRNSKRQKDTADERQTGLLKFQIALRRKLTPGVWTPCSSLARWLSRDGIDMVSLSRLPESQ